MSGYSVQKLLLATHTAPGDKNHLMIAEVRIPTDETAFDARKYDDQKGEVGGFGAVAGCKIEIKQRINHEGEVHRFVVSKPLRLCPDYEDKEELFLF